MMLENKKKMLFTGISGVCKKEYLSKIFPDIDIYSIEDRALTREGEIPIWKELDPKVRLERIKKAWEDAKEKEVITFHCVWWTPAGFMYDQFNMASFIKKEIKPDYLIVLINNITDARWYLQIKAEEGDKLASQIGFRDIIIWRSNEINVSRLLAQYIWPEDIKGHFYIIATGDFHKETIKELINTKKPKAYVAFPVRKFKENRKEIQKIKEEFIPCVKKHCVVFNPYAIYEKELEQLLVNPDPGRVPEVFTFNSETPLPSDNLFGDSFFPKDKKPQWFSITLWEITQVIRDINAQLVERDKLMVQQSDFVVAYRPLLSEGAQRELQWSIKFNRRAYAVIPEEDKEEWSKIAKALFEEELRNVETVSSIEELESILKKLKK